MEDLFARDSMADPEKPLAERMRPDSLEDVAGQDHLLSEGSVLRRAVQEDRLFSMILWGPPGCGKTTLARILAKETRKGFVQISAVFSGVQEVRKIIEEARTRRRMQGRGTLLFVDEIHRFNKAQQDAFLQHVEEGLITLIGATTENPSFEVIAALLSRCRVLVLHPVSGDACVTVLRRALADGERGLGRLGVAAADSELALLAEMADGDMRAALSGLEMAVFHCLGDGSRRERVVTKEDVAAVFGDRVLRHDKAGDSHFNLISAFHKSMRGSDPDGALYWLFRMLEAGEDPLYLARRMVRFASEDVGMADPGALALALSALESYRFLGSPEGEGALAQAAVYLATAPKSNAVYMAQKAVVARIRETGAPPVPLHIRNAPTRLMADLGYGREYRYAHDFTDAYVPQEYLPEDLLQDRYYHPTDRGYEKLVGQRMDGWRRIREAARKKS
ncbi:replication-associated recombination protein A [Desulfobotulus sp. H1]|uniref:Replication-associated recombination protein A n=1 Tax=Desulfobotulus pelophilus TaxID=2823377 RepID=A0ABT3N4L8_9BACT|nr:replication-associated recombination protein A [Desulfobotulus pelophilus]MCW7752404.1 replication-associated recombination protein A [Desulfobotulus pelophilus]